MLNSEPVTLVEYDGVGKGTAVALAAGSDGLYFSDFYQDLDYNSPIDAGANIYRIYYEDPNEPVPPEPEKVITTTDIYRFQNLNFPGSYLFAGGEERDLINANYANDFTEEGFAFKVGVNPEEDDDLIPIYRFQNNNLPGNYLFVNEGEKNLINTNYADYFTEEGLAFYVYGADSDQGDPFYRFQNTNLPGSYIFVNEEERNLIKANYPTFVEEGRAFNVLA